MAQQPMYPAVANSPQTELSAAITDAATSIAVLDASKLPAGPNIATIGVDETAETIRYAAISGNTLTGVTRGFQGAAKVWMAGAKVARNWTAYDADALRENISDLIDFLAYMPINGGEFDGLEPGGPLIDGGIY